LDDEIDEGFWLRYMLGTWLRQTVDELAHTSFLVICGMPRGSSWLGRYGLVKLEAPKNGQEALVGYKSMNERVKLL
jgi:hypothetical protein